MKHFSKQVARDWHHYPWFNLIWQSAAVLFVLQITLYCLRVGSATEAFWAVGVGSIASTCYMVFMRPHKLQATPVRIAGGYILAFLCGLLMTFVVNALDVSFVYPSEAEMHMLIFASTFAVLLFFVLSTLLRICHPPAAGIALISVLDDKDHFTLTVIMLVVFGIALMRLVLGRYLRDLINPRFHFDEE